MLQEGATARRAVAEMPTHQHYRERDRERAAAPQESRGRATVTPKLSDEAWALLGVLDRATSGGPAAPDGFEKAYAELQIHGLAHGKAITSKGADAWRDRFLRSDP